MTNKKNNSSKERAYLTQKLQKKEEGHLMF